jgi:hypothetical protein
VRCRWHISWWCGGAAVVGDVPAGMHPATKSEVIAMSNQPSQNTAPLSQVSSKIITRLSCLPVVTLVLLLVPSSGQAQHLPGWEENTSNTSAGHLTAQFDPRSQTPAKGGGKTGSAGTQDDGFGVCPAFSHYHEPINKEGGISNLQERAERDFRWDLNMSDGKCHRDDNDEPIKERPKLPKPNPNPKDKWL